MPNKNLYLQSFSETIYEGLEEGFIVGNGLKNIPICRHITDGPLAQSCTAQTEDVTEWREAKDTKNNSWKTGTQKLKTDNSIKSRETTNKINQKL